MSFNNEDILILAKAGFTAQQIAALNSVAPTPAPEAPAPAPVEAPAPAPEAPAPEPGEGDQFEVIQPSVVGTMDEILKSVQGLTQTFQNGFIMGAQQPKPVTAEDVLANIINPPSPKKEG